MLLAVPTQLVLTVGCDVTGIDTFQRDGSRLPVREELAAGMHVMKSGLPIGALLLQMLLKPQ